MIGQPIVKLKIPLESNGVNFLAITEMLEHRIGRRAINAQEKLGLLNYFKKQKLRLHSVRRSGLVWWRGSQRLSIDKLLEISLHSSVQVLLGYLNGQEDSDSDEE